MKVLLTLFAFVILFFSLRAQTTSSPVMEAVVDGSTTVLDQLIASGANLNSQDQEGHTPLMIAIKDGNDYMAEKLIKAKADIHIKNKYGENALLMACWYKRTKIASRLIDEGSDINNSTPYGSPLIFTAEHGLEDLTYKLLSDPKIFTNGHDINLRTPLHHAIRSDSPHLSTVLEKLVQKGANLNSEDKFGFTPLMQATRNLNYKAVETLLDLHSDINYQNSKGNTALALAGQRGRLKLMEHLKKRGATEVAQYPYTVYIPDPKLTPAQKWALATTCILTLRNGDEFESLSFWGYKNSGQAAFQNTLKNWWSVTSKKDLLQTLDWLKKEGHRKSFSQKIRYIWIPFFRNAAESSILQNYSKDPANAFLGWDLCRYIWVVRAGYNAGYLSENEAWDYIMPVAKELQSHFKSWHDMGESYLAGRKLWLQGRGFRNILLSNQFYTLNLFKSGDEESKDDLESKFEDDDNASFEHIFNHLADTKNPNSPWTKNTWDTPLK